MLSPPDHIEQIFQKVEAESERRAQEERRASVNDDSPAQDTTTTRKRGGSVSVSRFGQPIEPVPENAASVITVNPSRLSRIASKSHFYQSQIHANSKDSFATEGSGAHHEHHEDEDHVTQMTAIGGRQTLSKAVGTVLSRTLSRSRSNSQSVVAAPALSTTVVIGVSVEQATVAVEHHDDENHVSGSKVYALRNQPSRASLRKEGWVSKVAQKFRRKSKSPLKDDYS
ncbi:hypothetical protein JAAARDRAFT_73973 [Jaapia argillacea MUCL 33604]|uniref:Uncharacterized protein n=1 Tax=Jaapia argillacea MUCL 33604 TaxID=933084 RepID=A0A067P7L3_9AGAM|nr:hypothetical protein JAAARDRAFT_73973 [Jaapia argillacea MUCL 33604]